MNFETKIILIFLLGFLFINIPAFRVTKEEKTRNVIVSNIGITTFMFSIFIDKIILCLLSMILLVAFKFSAEKRDDFKVIFTELISLIILTPLVYKIPDLAYPELASPFSRGMGLNIGILISVVILFLNIYYTKKLKAEGKTLILFVFLNIILYAEYLYLIFSLIR